MTAILLLSWLSLLCFALAVLAWDMSRNSFQHREIFFVFIVLALAVQFAWGLSL